MAFFSLKKSLGKSFIIPKNRVNDLNDYKEGIMKHFKTLISLVALSLILASCGSSDKREEATPPPAPEKDFEMEYVLSDASEGDRPDWILNPYKADGELKASKFRYFVSEGKNRNKRLCMKSSQARATAQVAGEITQFIKNTYSEATQGSEDEDVTQYMQEQLTQEIQSFIVGARVGRKYWEQRKYKKDMGASKDYKIFNCYSLVQIEKGNLNKMIRMARQKILASISDSEVKAKTKKAIKDVEGKFDQLDKPVQLDDEA
jgi:hypothetical protein